MINSGPNNFHFFIFSSSCLLNKSYTKVSSQRRWQARQKQALKLWHSEKYGYLLSANADDWSWKIHKLFWEKSSDASSLHEWNVDIICLQMQTAGFDKCTTTQQTNLYIDSAQIQTNPWGPLLLHAYATMSCHRDNLSYWRRWLVIIILMIKLCQNY